jgi:hypothetical protein
MAQVAEQFSDVLLDDIKGHPEVITDLLFDQDDISLILEKRGKVVRLAYMRRYSTETTRMLEEAKQEYAQYARDGYDREQAAQDLLEAQQEIRQHTP